MSDVTSDTEPSTPLPPGASRTTPVRSDLYDEQYSDEEYAEMLALYEGTLQSIAEGEIVVSKVLRVTETHVILDVGFKSEGAVSIDDTRASDPFLEIEPRGEPYLIKVGKRRFLRLSVV